jgi:TetR/AcrR family transcriptional regulator, transcriptional repressor for nem operon
VARTVNPEAYSDKRNKILNVTQRLVFTKGFDRMTIQDILEALQISSGAFYHYFDSKQAVLEGFIERIRQESEKPLLPVIRDPGRSAIEKLQGFFDVFDQLRSGNRPLVISLLRVWTADENAVVRQRVEAAVFEQRVPLVAEIVRQGMTEGVFTAGDPHLTAEVVLSLVQGMGSAHMKQMLAVDQEDMGILAERVVATHSAYMAAIERVLGVPPNSLYRVEVDAAQAWLAAIKSSPPVGRPQ